jgi:hypothetical protein
MQNKNIAEIQIDSAGRLCVLPMSTSFEQIYRAAMQVHWDNVGKYLYSPSPGEWSYERWFQQILAAVKEEYGSVLTITPETRWRNVDDSLKSTITANTEQSTSG